MKREVHPRVVFAIIAVAVLAFAAFTYRTLTGPTATSAGERKGPMPPPSRPTAEQLQQMREYNAAHAAPTDRR